MTLGPIVSAKHSKRVALLAFAGCLGGLAFAAPAEAGLFDFLFGAQPNYAPAPVYQTEPLGVRVRPRRSHRSARPDRVRAEANRKPVLATPIDPVTHPNWYLEDPTLRRGDIVVLKGRVLVFEGSRRNTGPEDFTALSQSRLLSKRERERIAKMADTRGGAEPVNEKTAAGNKQVSLASP